MVEYSVTNNREKYGLYLYAMTSRDVVFLRLLRAAVGLDNETELPPLTSDEWSAVFSLAERHHVLPLVLDAAHRAGADVPSGVFAPYQRRAMRLVSLQPLKPAAFLELIRFLEERGLEPLVMKGLICRELYPRPDFRFSADEDLLIPPESVAAYHAALTAYGLTASLPEEEISSAQPSTLFQTRISPFRLQSS